ncbi:MAG: DNA topoisomerase 3 [Sphaerochaetaceae bacterium]|nr:DNA topoisomerase 3 [Sphaerochaetaceae bacterium]
MKKLVLAEKPSVGRELASVLGCINRGKYLEGPSYVVTWALGHLVTLCPPDSYGEKYRRWSLGNLPMLPEVLDTMVIEKTKDQFELVKSLLDRDDIESVVIATDAGREGELVARWILKQAECTKKTERLWISSQTESAIRQGFENLKDGKDYDNLYYAAESRSYADWYIGFNVSRAMSCHFDSRLSAGRVQTPTLALITEREDEIESFAGKFYWTIRADFGRFKASYYTEENTVKIQDEEKANSLYTSLKGKTGKVVSVKKVSKTEKPPLAYDLTELQRDANMILGFSAKQTLDTLQRLYEVHKIVTYPRTDSRYITDDIVPTFSERLAALKNTDFAPLCPAVTDIRADLTRLVNNAMVSDHHALLPTEQPVDVSKLSFEEKQLWELVISRFLETLSDDYEYSTTTVEIDVEGCLFSARMTMPDKQGWRDITRRMGRRFSTSVEDDSEFGLYGLKEGSEVTVNDVELKRFATMPPQRYTEADLLYAMEHAGRLVDDSELRKRLENGLGTPATRADIIEKLIQNNCMERKDGFLVPTAKGRELVRLVPPQLKSAELTGQWEKRLYEISGGKESEKPFIEDIKKNAADLVKEVVANRDTYDPTRMGDPKHVCPFCAWPMAKVLDAEGRVHYVCQRFSCGYEEMIIKKQIKDKVLLAKSVVKESHYRRAERKTEKTERSFGSDSGNGGGTFADFIRASEERKKGRKH